MERAQAAGRDLACLASVASFFVSRVDTEVDHRLDAIGTARPRRCAAGPRSPTPGWPSSAYERGLHLRALAARSPQAGARPQRPLWASTGVKDPAYPDTRYVLELVTTGVVNTMPEATLRAVADHGALRGDTVHPGYDEAAEVMTALADLGINYDAVMRDLEHDGLTIFQASWSSSPTPSNASSPPHAAAKRKVPHERPTHIRHRRRGPGRRQSRRGAARRRIRRKHRPARRRAPPALRAATAVQGLPAGQRRPRHGLRAPARVVRRPRRSTCGSTRSGHRGRPHAHGLVTADGNRLRYDKLLLATGSTPRRLPVPGADLGRRALPAHASTTATDLKAALQPGTQRGGHRRGLDRAGDRRRGPRGGRAGHPARDTPSCRCSGPRPPGGQGVRRPPHATTASTCAAAWPSPRSPGHADPATAGTVLLADGTELPADVVIVGVGITPNIELARSCGLNVDNGILTDEHLRTSDNDILAAGDVANAYHPLLGRQLRVEHWANALHQPVVAAKTMLGQTATYDRLPYFFTDQYDLGMEYLGYTDPDGYDQVVIRGDTASREFVAFWLHRGHVVAGMNVNVWDVTEPIRALIQSGEQVDASRLSDPAIPLTRLLRC